MTYETSPRRTLLIGWRGGVGTATLNLLAEHPLGRRLAGDSHILLLDADDAEPVPAAPLPAEILPAETLLGREDLERVIRRHDIERVLDFGASNTIASAEACAATGADYLSTCYDPLHYRDAGPPTGPHLMQGARDLLPKRRPSLSGGSHLVGSGMNPGTVSALLLTGLDQFADRARTSPDDLDLYAIFITEIDTTASDDPPADDVFAITWSPQHCLSEILEPEALYVSRGDITPLGHRPTAAHYRVRCGDEAIEGFAVPHEELVWLGHRFPSCEVAYLYQIPRAAEAALGRYPDRDAESWKTRRLIPPSVPADELAGIDRVGVLLCSRRHGELWLGFETDMQQARRFGTNATELQVASGVLAGWAQLGARAGIHVVEEIDYRRFLRDVESVLGRAATVYDPDAPPVPLSRRRVTG